MALASRARPLRTARASMARCAAAGRPAAGCSRVLPPASGRERPAPALTFIGLVHRIAARRGGDSASRKEPPGGRGRTDRLARRARPDHGRPSWRPRVPVLPSQADGRRGAGVFDPDLVQQVREVHPGPVPTPDVNCDVIARRDLRTSDPHRHLGTDHGIARRLAHDAHEAARIRAASRTRSHQACHHAAGHNLGRLHRWLTIAPIWARAGGSRWRST